MKKFSSLNYLKQIVAFATLFALLSNTTLAATYVVDRNDGVDTAGACTLVANDCSIFDAVRLANAAIEVENDVINTDQGGSFTVSPSGSIAISSNITIDSTATNRIILNGGGASNFSALTLDSNSDGSQVRGMSIYGFNGALGVGMEILSGADSITIGGTTATGNIIGLLPDAVTAGANNAGIISAGTNVTMNGNFVSASTENGIFINGGTDISIKNNTIGLNSDGDDRGNGFNGIYASGVLDLDAWNGWVEGLEIGGARSLNEGNLISGNGLYGVSIGDGVGDDMNGTVKIQGNYIGVNQGGVARPNDSGGINFAADADNLDLLIGTDGNGLNDDDTEGNVIGSNGGIGINIAEGDDVFIAGNDIGLLAGGEARGNTGVGIKVGAVGMGGPNTLVIGTDNSDPFEGNNIGSNTAGGVLIENATTIDFHGNRVGMDASGTARGNTGGAALKINSTDATTVNIGTGGALAIDTDGSNYFGNSPATFDGALVISNTASGADVEIKSNRFGLITSDSGVATNATNGLYLTAPADYIIGTDLDTVNDTYERNYIANSVSNGIYVGNGPLTLIISGVTMGLATNGMSFTYDVAAPNGLTGAEGEQNGVKIQSDSLTLFTFGGADPAQRNIVASSLGNGLSIVDVGVAIDFTIRNSIFGFASDLTTARDNTVWGIFIGDGGAISLIDNVVGNSNAAAINLAGGTSYTITGNKIGTDYTGLISHGNGGAALILNAATITSAIIGGSTAALSNIFASSTGDGIYIEQLNSSASTVSILGNYIGVCANTATGDIATGNLASCTNNAYGIEALYGALTIGGDNALTDAGTGTISEANVISNNGVYGVKIGGANVSSVTMYSNIIGLIRALGSQVFSVAAPNGSANIDVDSSGLTSFVLGGVGSVTASSKRAIVSSSVGNGLQMENMAITGVATIMNTFFGTDWLGTTDRGNTGIGTGIAISFSTPGPTVNIGGVAANQGNVISGNEGSGIDVGDSAVTVNIYKNIIGLDSTGSVVLPNYGTGISIDNAGATVTIGDGTAAGRNLIADNALYAIHVAAATAVNVSGNYIGVSSNGTTSIPNATDTVTLGLMSLPVAEMYFTAISGALTVSGNTINNSTHVGGYYLDETPTNESTMTADNTWYTKVNATVPTYNFWQRYSGATLAAFGPKACDDGYDNDSDGLVDLADAGGCSSAADTDETDPVAEVVVTPGGGGFVPSSPSPKPKTPTPEPTPEPAIPAPAPEPALAPEPAPAPEPVTDLTLAEQNVKDFVVAQKLKDSVSSVTNLVAGNEVISDKLLVALANQETAVTIPEPVLTSDQKEVKASLAQLSEGKTLSAEAQQKVEAIVQTQIQQAVESFSKKIEAGAVAGANLQVISSSGVTKTITKNTKIVFVLDKSKAEEVEKNANADVIVVGSDTIIGNNSVSALYSVINNGKIGDPDAAEKLFFGGPEAMADDKVNIPNKTKATNLKNGTKVASTFLMWLAGPKPGEKVSVFAIDKKGSTDPKVWKTINLGNYQLDEKNKTAVEIDLSDEMDADLKTFTIVVQDEAGNGTYSDVILDKNEEMKMDKVEIKSDKKIISDKGGKEFANLAVASVKGDGTTPDVSVLSGYADPGSVVFVTWKSTLLTSTVIADTNGQFVAYVPKPLETGDHTAYIYSYNQTKRTASTFKKLMFSKFF